MRLNFDLVSMARRQKRARVSDPREIRPTQSLERDAVTIFAAIIRVWRDQMRDVVLPAYGAAIATSAGAANTGGGISFGRDRLAPGAVQRLQEVITAAAAAGTAQVENSSTQVEAWTTRVERWQRAQWAARIHSATGVDARALLDGSDVEEELKVAVSRVTSVLVTLNYEMRRRVEAVIWTGLSRRTAKGRIEESFGLAIGIVRRRAANAADEQTMKLTAELNELRQRQAGIGAYVWRAGSSTTRPAHLARNGKVYRWSDPLRPGHDPHCHCVAQAHLGLA